MCHKRRDQQRSKVGERESSMRDSMLKAETTRGRNNQEAVGEASTIRKLTMVRITTMARSTTLTVTNKHNTRKEGKTSPRKPYMRNVNPRETKEKNIRCHPSRTARSKVPQLKLTAQFNMIKISLRCLMISIKRKLTKRSTKCPRSKTAGLRAQQLSPINQEEVRTIARLKMITTRRIRSLWHPNSFHPNQKERGSNISPAIIRKLSRRKSTMRMPTLEASLRGNINPGTKIAAAFLSIR